MQYLARIVLRKSVVVTSTAICAIMLPSFFAEAQVPVTAGRPPTSVTTTPAVQQDSQRTVAVILVKNALLAVNQGNLTGNYTVLRDLASPGFREKNSAADLAGIFKNIRQQKLDLSPIVVIDPVLNPPRINAEGQLLLDGHFEAQQMRITFQLAFLKAPTNGWMIHGVSLNAVPLAAAVASGARP